MNHVIEISSSDDKVQSYRIRMSGPIIEFFKLGRRWTWTTSVYKVSCSLLAAIGDQEGIESGS